MTPPSASVQPAIPATPILPGQIPTADPKAPPPGGKPHSPTGPGLPEPTGPRAHPLFGKFSEKTPSDPKQAAKHGADGDKFFEKKDWKRAVEAYEKAFAANPGDKRVLLRLASSTFQAGDPLASHDYLSFYLDTHPEDMARRKTRLQLGQMILGELQKGFEKFSEAEQKKLQPLVLGILLEGKIDQAVLLAHTSAEQFEGLKKTEAELKALHSEGREKKQAALAEISAMVEEMTELTRLNIGDPKLAQKVQEELPKIIAEAFGVLFRFAKEDPDESIRKMAPLFEGYHFLAQGKVKEAIPPFEQVRREGCQSLGGGDEKKGREKLNQIHADTQKFLSEKKYAEARKALSVLPPGLLDAHLLLERAEEDHLRRANLAAVEAWKDKINQDWHQEREDAESGLTFVGGSISAAFRGIFGDGKTRFDDINGKSAAERDVAYEVERKLVRGEAKTVSQALEQIRDKGSENLKGRAKELLEGKDPLAGLIGYLSSVKPDAALEKGLLTAAGAMKGKAWEQHFAASIFSLVEFHSRDAAVKKEAGSGIEKEKQNAFLKGFLG